MRKLQAAQTTKDESFGCYKPILRVPETSIYILNKEL